MIRACGVLLLFCVFASGCSVKFVYDNADRLIRWSANDYVDFTQEQDQYLDAELDALMYWHRSEELPRYATVVERFQTEFDLPTSGDRVDLGDLERVIVTLEGFGDVLEARGLPVLTQILLSLTQEQRDELPRRIAEGNDELSEDEIGKSDEAIRRRWRREVTSGFKRFVGRLNDEQKVFIETQSFNYVPQMQLWVAYRERWQTDLLTLLEAPLDPQRKADELARLVQSQETYHGEEFNAAMKANETLAKQTMHWILNHLTLRQRAHFTNFLDALAQDLRELHAERATVSPAHASCLVIVEGC